MAILGSLLTRQWVGSQTQCRQYLNRFTSGLVLDDMSLTLSSSAQAVVSISPARICVLSQWYRHFLNVSVSNCYWHIKFQKPITKPAYRKNTVLFMAYRVIYFSVYDI